MDQQSIVTDIEKRADALGLSNKRLCELAEVHPTTFSRWKAAPGREAAVAKMDGIERLWRTLERLEAKAATVT